MKLSFQPVFERGKIIRMKKIYITGLAGMLGSNLAFLLKDSYEVFGVDLMEVKMQEFIQPITIYWKRTR